MIEILLTRGDREIVYQLERASNLLGRSVDNEVSIRGDGTIARRHAILSECDGRMWIEDLRSTNGTKIEGERIKTRTRLEIGQKVTFGTVSFQVVRHEPVISPDFEAREAGFLEPLHRNPDDEAIREVYSDDLETRGETLRASWLRAELALRRARTREERTMPLRTYNEIDQRLTAARRWRMLVARPEIERCSRVDCPTKWGNLAPHENERNAVIIDRACTTCGLTVAYQEGLDQNAVAMVRSHSVIAVDRVATEDVL